MVQIHSPRPLLSLRSLAHSVHTFLFCLELPWLRLWIPRSYKSDASGLGLFCEVHCAAFVVFYLRVWFLESIRAGSWRAGHAMLCKKPKRWHLITLLSSLDPHTYRIHRRVFNSTVKLTTTDERGLLSSTEGSGRIAQIQRA